MRAVIQHLGTGVTELAQVPAPGAQPRHLLIRTTASMVSAGTERMLVEFGRAGLIGKARSQPDKVRQVLDKVRTDGLAATLATVRAKLDQPIALGYCNAGVVIAVGEGVSGFTVGDRVVSNGPHAEVVCVPATLCARIPEVVTDETAAATVLGAIALQGVRLLEPTLGESVVVLGLGLVGLMAVQVLRANGCRVLGIDRVEERCALARTLGAEAVTITEGVDAVAVATAFARGRGVDAVVVATATGAQEPVRQAAHMCRQRGRIVLVGVAGLDLVRDDFYKKELSFQVSCSYGPGRYDPSYEQDGRDYPQGFVRWTAQRNFEAVLDLMASGALRVQPLVTHRIPVERAADAYALLVDGVPALGIVLDYSSSSSEPLARSVSLGTSPAVAKDAVHVAVIGAGGYGGKVLLPALARSGARLTTVASRGGVSALHAARSFGFQTATTDLDQIFNDARIDAVVIATRHDSHASLTCRALRAGKHVFVEKPLALDRGQLAEVMAAAQGTTTSRMLMVGFNRRFSPHAVHLRSLLATVAEPKVLTITVNAGLVPAEHWTRDPAVGGGRIIGEACHFIDLLRFLVGAGIISTHAVPRGPANADEGVITLRFADGSVGTVIYCANGHRSFPKERIEVFAGGRVVQLDNFRRMRGYGWPGFSSMNLWRQDKGNAAGIAAFLTAVKRGGVSPIPLSELNEVSEACFTAAEALRT